MRELEPRLTRAAMAVRSRRTSEFKRLMGLLGPRVYPYAVGLAGVCVTEAGISILAAFVLRDMINAAVEGQMALLLRATMVFAGALPVIAVVNPMSAYLYTRCAKQTITEVRLKLFRHMEDLPAAYYERRHSGDLISRITNDVQAMEQAYTSQLRMVLLAVVFGLGSTTMIFTMNRPLAWISLLIGGACAYANSLFAGPLRRINDELQKQLGRLSERFTDLLAGFQVMKIYHLERIILEGYCGANRKARNLAVSRGHTSGLLDATNSVAVGASFLGIIVVGAFMVYRGSADFGTALAAVQLQNGISFMFRSLGSFVAQLQSSLAGAQRVFEILDEPCEPERYAVKELSEGHGDGQRLGHRSAQTAEERSGECSDVPMVEMQDVVFSYVEGRKALAGFSMCVAEGNVAALVGPSGSGKSTVQKILLGLHAPESGKVVLASKPLGCYTLSQLRQLTAYVPQDAYLFDGTIEESIRYGRLDATGDDVVAAARAANAHDFIMQLPQGYDTLVGERGSHLSGGQRQRIAIARALLKQAPILLLDEATSALDSESEKLVQQALEVLMRGRTTVVVAHRLSTIENADIIYVMDGGRVVEQGRHSELLAKGGLYRELYASQFGYADEAEGGGSVASGR